jgi:hypothetical protein
MPEAPLLKRRAHCDGTGIMDPLWSLGLPRSPGRKYAYGMRPVSDDTDECFVHQYRPRGHYKAHEVNLDVDVERGPE